MRFKNTIILTSVCFPFGIFHQRESYPRIEITKKLFVSISLNLNGEKTTLYLILFDDRRSFLNVQSDTKDTYLVPELTKRKLILIKLLNSQSFPYKNRRM